MGEILKHDILRFREDALVTTKKCRRDVEVQMFW